MLAAAMLCGRTPHVRHGVAPRKSLALGGCCPLVEPQPCSPETLVLDLTIRIVLVRVVSQPEAPPKESWWVHTWRLHDGLTEFETGRRPRPSLLRHKGFIQDGNLSRGYQEKSRPVSTAISLARIRFQP